MAGTLPGDSEGRSGVQAKDRLSDVGVVRILEKRGRVAQISIPSNETEVREDETGTPSTLEKTTGSATVT
jgi:hypothetical protein